MNASDAEDKAEKKNHQPNRRSILRSGTALVAASTLGSGAAGVAQAQEQQPASSLGAGASRISSSSLVTIIGQSDISAYTFGLMGYRTPNIDRIAKEGLMFTDYYAEQSCTAGRSSFITGQSVIRTGLSKVGNSAATVGLQAQDITIAEALKPLGYATGQLGKIISATATNICRPCMASMNSSAISIT